MKMDYDDVRGSLDWRTYTQHAKGLMMVSEENYDLMEILYKSNQDHENQDTKMVGLLRSYMLLCAVGVELVLKAYGLFVERDKILNGNIKNFNDFMSVWKKGNGHYYKTLIDHYEISIQESEMKILEELQPYSVWCGRFPYPLDENEIKKHEKGLSTSTGINKNELSQISCMIERLTNQMSDLGPPTKTSWSIQKKI